MVEAGAEDALIWDAHGPGAVVFEMLASPARLLHGRPGPPRDVLADLVREFDVCMLLGQHAMAGVPDGNLHHTQSSQRVDRYTLNGQEIGEIAQFALFCGALGLPMVFLSGDEAACREATQLIPDITTAAVKTGLARNAAISLPAEEARRRIHQGAAAAIRKQRSDPIAPLSWPGPYVLEKRYFHTDTADAAASRPGAERVDGQTVRLRSENILEIIYA